MYASSRLAEETGLALLQVVGIHVFQLISSLCIFFITATLFSFFISCKVIEHTRIIIINGHREIGLVLAGR